MKQKWEEKTANINRHKSYMNKKIEEWKLKKRVETWMSKEGLVFIYPFQKDHSFFHPFYT